MAYPGEKSHKRYVDYAIDESSAGRAPSTKRDWTAAQKAAAEKKKKKKSKS